MFMMSAPLRPIRFLHRGLPVSVQVSHPTRTVLQWLREDVHATGTKEGCAEGDCGACTVLVAELDDAAAGDAATYPTQAIRSNGLLIRPVNACIRFLPTLNGKALLTVEDLAQGAPRQEALHPAQAALIEHHGSQCGFCTPGFVMTLAACHERYACQPGSAPPDRGELADALAGNLCRCTGYRPILDAAQAMFSQPEPRLPLAGLREKLLVLRAQAEAEAATRSAMGRSGTPPAHPGGTLGHPAYHAPGSLAELARLRVLRPEARLLAGGTDIGLWVTKQLRSLGELIWLGDVPELRQIRLDAAGSALEIGAAVPLEDAWAALLKHWPQLAGMARRFAGPPVRHAGTLVGNLANGSPIGDAAPVLMALGASLLLRRGEATRQLALPEFYLGYMENALQPGEFIERVLVPLETAAPHGAGASPAERWRASAFKVSKRHDCDISAVSAGLAVRLRPAGDGPPVVAEARLAFGGMAAVVKRAALAEAALNGQPWSEASIRQAMAALAQDFTPMSDLRASAAYRQRVAAALLHKFWLGADAPGVFRP